MDSCHTPQWYWDVPLLWVPDIYYKALELSLTDLIWQIRHNYNDLDDGHFDVTGHRNMSVLDMAGAMVTAYEHSLMI